MRLEEETYQQFMDSTEPVRPEDIRDGDLVWLDGMAVDFNSTRRSSSGKPLTAYQPIYGGYIELSPDDMQEYEARRKRA